MDNNLILQVKIISPKNDIFTCPALSVSSVNSVGKFDILPQHANFITLIKDVPIIIKKTNHETVTFNFPLAIIYNNKNRVNIYTDIQYNLY